MYYIEKKFNFEGVTNSCPICNTKHNNLMIHITKKGDNEHNKLKNFLELFVGEISISAQKNGELIKEIISKIKMEHPWITSFYKTDVSLANVIREEYRKAGVSSRNNVSKRMRLDNLMHSDESKGAVSESVSDLWKNGHYENRINGMTGVCGEAHPNYKAEKHQIESFGVVHYRPLYDHLIGIGNCKRCGCESANLHHIDENHENFLPSNLEELCVPCHSSYHYANQKQPFVTISKDFYIPAAHFLPFHDRRCAFLHGHEWKLTVYIKKRIDKKTGMVMDFSHLKKIVNDHVVDELDHNFINNYVENPTAETILFWVWDQLMFNGLKGIERIDLWESKDSLAFITKKEALEHFCLQFHGKMLSLQDNTLLIEDHHED